MRKPTDDGQVFDDNYFPSPMLPELLPRGRQDIKPWADTRRKLLKMYDDCSDKVTLKWHPGGVNSRDWDSMTMSVGRVEHPAVPRPVLLNRSQWRWVRDCSYQV